MSATPAPEPLPEFVAPPTWRSIDFISDLHLAESTPLAFAAWHEFLLNTTADAVVILGDLFEAWVGDDSRHEGFEARGAAVLKEASALRPVFFMIGNRDFLLGKEMLDACGVVGLADPTVMTAFGERVLLTHGDAWCVGDVEYQQFRRTVRNSAWQAVALATPLAQRRILARSMRSESERRMAENSGGPWFDVDTPTALQWLARADARTLVHGHTHHAGTQALSVGVVRHVLSDWQLDEAQTPRAEVLRWQPGSWSRLAPDDAVDHER